MNSEKVAIVTGGNKGIGFGIVRRLCAQFPGTVYLTARDVTRGKNAVQQLEKEDLHPKFHQLDITDQTSVDQFRDYIQTKYGGIDVLVNNAAIAFKQDATDPFDYQAEVTLNVNYFSLLRVCNALFPLLRSNARVVNVSSSAGHLSRIPGAELRAKLADSNLTEAQLSALMKQFVESAKAGKNASDGWGNSAYMVSKVGVSALTFIQQRLFDSDKNRVDLVVNAVHPGYVDTDMTSHKGVLTVEQGSEAAAYLALLPPNEKEIKGRYVWHDRKVVDWQAPLAQQY